MEIDAPNPDQLKEEELFMAAEGGDSSLFSALTHDQLSRALALRNDDGRSLLHVATLVNLGSEVYMQAEVPDTRHIFVDIGLGFHVEFTWSEALKFIQLREEKMARKIEEHTDLIASIKAQIKVVGEGIRELLQLSAEVQDRDDRVF